MQYMYMYNQLCLLKPVYCFYLLNTLQVLMQLFVLVV